MEAYRVPQNGLGGLAKSIPGKGLARTPGWGEGIARKKGNGKQQSVFGLPFSAFLGI